MESTGDARSHLREVVALVIALAVLVALTPRLFESGATAQDLPSCGSGNYLAGTCEPDASGHH